MQNAGSNAPLMTPGTQLAEELLARSVLDLLHGLPLKALLRSSFGAAGVVPGVATPGVFKEA